MKFFSPLLFLVCASSFALDPSTRYSDLTCLTPTQLSAWKKDHAALEFKAIPGNLCGDQSFQEKLGKLLRALPELAIASAKSSGNFKVDSALGDPQGTFLAKANSITLNETLVVESHRWRGGGGIELAPHFFLLSPFEAAVDLLALIADSEMASDYNRCSIGKYILNAACEKYYRPGDNAGFASTKIQLLLRLAQTAKDAVKSERIRALASQVAVQRIARMPAQAGMAIDLLYALDTRGSLHRIDPFTKTLTPVALPEIVGVITKIKHDRVTGGLLLFTAEGRLWKFHPEGESVSEVKLPFAIKDYEHVSTFLLNGATKSRFPIEVMIDQQDRVWLADVLGPNAGNPPWPAPSHQLPFELKSITNCWISASCMLDQLGHRWSFQYFFSGVEQDEYYNNSDGLPWRSLSGGFFYDEIWGVNASGKLYYRDGYSGEDLILDPHLQSQSPSTFNYLETSSFRALIDAENRIYISRDYIRRVDSAWPDTHGVRTWELKLPSAGIADVERVFLYRFPGGENAAENSRATFESECRVTRAIFNPWSGKNMGLTSDGRIAFETQDHRCDYWAMEKFADQSVLSVVVDEKERLSHPESALSITAPDGTQRMIAPYNR